MAHPGDKNSSWRSRRVVGRSMQNQSSMAVMATRRALLFILTIHTELPEKRFHVPHILAEIIERLVHSLFRHVSDLADDV